MAPLPPEQTGESTAGSGDSHRTLPTPFLSKTYQLVDDPTVDDLISWNDDGSSFIVWKPAEFARDLLPKYFKHNNFSSFVRQLNTYAFRKVVTDRWEFANDCFRRGEKRLLRDIHRRRISPAAASPPTVSPPAPTPLRMVSPESSGNEQTHSSDSCSAPAVATVERTRSGSSTAEIVEENDRLRRDNLNLSQDLNHLRELCSNILGLMSNYASGQEATGGLPEGRPSSDVVPAKGMTVEGSRGGVSSGGATGSGRSKEGERAADEEAADTCPWPRLFGVSIGAKRVRREEDEEEENQGLDV